MKFSDEVQITEGRKQPYIDILKQTKAKVNRVLHIGCDEQSDRDFPRALGMNAYLYVHHDK